MFVMFAFFSSTSVNACGSRDEIRQHIIKILSGTGCRIEIAVPENRAAIRIQSVITAQRRQKAFG